MSYELYAFESYQIYDDPGFISMEASIEGDLGGTKFERDEKRLLAAVKAGDEESAKQIKSEIDAKAEAIRKEAQKEKNKQLVRSALNIAAKAASIGAWIYGMINSKKEGTKWAQITAGGNGATPADVAAINALRAKNSKVSNISTGVQITSNLVNMVLGG